MNNRTVKSIDWQLACVAAFTILYLAVGMVLAAGKKNWEFVFYIPIVVLFGLIAVAIRHRANLPMSLLWCLSVWGLLHVVGGVIEVPAGWPVDGDKRSFYSWEIIPGILVYDKPVHAFGFGIATWACWRGLSATCGDSTPTVGRLTLAVLAGMGLGALNEVVEFIASQTMDTNVGGYVNTGGDLIANMVGGLFASLLIAIASRLRPASENF
ncbi:MAG: hypothetical protein IT423_08645 [Pirellulaceae bacterium]|nr:hypothetical protein [Pirellulaceae bacterium]